MTDAMTVGTLPPEFPWTWIESDYPADLGINTSLRPFENSALAA